MQNKTMENSRSTNFHQGRCCSLGGLSCAYNARLFLLKSDGLALKKSTVDSRGKCSALSVNISEDKGNYPAFLSKPQCPM